MTYLPPLSISHVNELKDVARAHGDGGARNDLAWIRYLVRVEVDKDAHEESVSLNGPA